VNRFLPGRPPAGSSLASWDWRLFRRNHGPVNLAATLAFWLAAGIRAQAGQG
jgi:hypothetical protein